MSVETSVPSVIGFLRSCIRSGEQLSAEDEATVAAALADAQKTAQELAEANDTLRYTVKRRLEETARADAAEKERDAALARVKALEGALEAAREELNCPQDEGFPTHWCANCDSSVDRNREVRQRIDRLLAPAQPTPEVPDEQ
jgi:DNA repair exonuclease SbcCD ATPase subunit